MSLGMTPYRTHDADADANMIVCALMERTDIEVTRSHAKQRSDTEIFVCFDSESCKLENNECLASKLA